MSSDVAVRRKRLAWLRPPETSVDGTMALVDHLKELRYRITISAIAMLVLTIAMLFVYEAYLLPVILRPLNIAIDSYQASHPDALFVLTTEGLTSPMMLMLKTAGVAGLILSCPVWLYQLWSFIAPGLLSKEKKYSLAFLGSAIPLFLMGVALGYWITPKGFAVMLAFTPEGQDITNLQEVQKFLTFELRLLLVFGVSFLLPVIIVMMNHIGLVKAEQLAKFRTPAVFLCFVFGAVATPSTDPFSMVALSIPMSIMYVIAEVICRNNERRKAKRLAELELAD
ncbi:MAG TPA: twin-arginine translocase subunit TatC [Propionibacteriaceae bacterium]|nr:twin-arginine translocase subunit TatC [Propionibacteriaceae bacterium]